MKSLAALLLLTTAALADPVNVWMSYSGRLRVVELPSPIAMDFLPNEIVRVDSAGSIIRNGVKLENLDREELIAVVRELVETQKPKGKRR